MSLDYFNNNNFDLVFNILSGLPCNVFFKDAQCKYVFCTNIGSFFDTEDIKNKTELDLRNNEDGKKIYSIDQEIIKSGKGSKYYINHEVDNTFRCYEVISNPVYDNENNIIGIVGIFSEVLKDKQVIYTSMTDQMTGLYNRTYLDYWLCNLNNKALYPLSLVFADCDKLKTVNDSLGHIYGDKYIIETVSLFKNALPENAIIIRMGGDEFLAIIPNSKLNDAKRYISDMKSSANNITINGRKLSVSFGSCEVLKYDEDLAEAIDAADKEMYQEKHSKLYE